VDLIVPKDIQLQRLVNHFDSKKGISLPIKLDAKMIQEHINEGVFNIIAEDLPAFDASGRFLGEVSSSLSRRKTIEKVDLCWLTQNKMRRS